jgi:hypothetical protein
MCVTCVVDDVRRVWGICMTQECAVRAFTRLLRTVIGPGVCVCFAMDRCVNVHS